MILKVCYPIMEHSVVTINLMFQPSSFKKNLNGSSNCNFLKKCITTQPWKGLWSHEVQINY
jgi:hypothetical protein